MQDSLKQIGMNVTIETLAYAAFNEPSRAEAAVLDR